MEKNTIISLYDISWKVPEDTYRIDKGISYSTLAKFQREGFSKLSSLFDRVESPSLTFGSMVDTLLTDGKEAFNDKFTVVEYTPINDSQKKVCDYLLKEWNLVNFAKIPESAIGEACTICEYQKNWKPDTRIKVIKENCESYFNAVAKVGDKIAVTVEEYSDCIGCVEALKTSDATSFYFAPDNPFDGIKRYYQLKFKGEYNGIPIRCMADELIADYNTKTIIPCDLKTSYHKEYEFPESFVTWYYLTQAGMYSYIIQQNLLNNDYFKDWKVAPYRFIVVNRYEKNPLVWEFGQTFSVNDIVLGDKVYPNWRKSLAQLYQYLQEAPKVPVGISLTEPNSIERYFMK